MKAAALLPLLILFSSPLSGAQQFAGAPSPAAQVKPSPLSPEEQLASFTLPPGFEIELVAAEEPGVGKFIAVDFDQKGRMWSMTAFDYPVDGNEDPEAAKALYAQPGRDKVLVWDTPFAGGAQKPRIFADGLAIPLGVLPYGDGAYVQHGPDIVFLSDTDADGHADKREVILSGFGVQDSHLFPHQFTRAPGGWLWMAQGAFNYGKVKTTRGVEQQFDQTRMAKFRPDGSAFEITSQGPCNIWGLVLSGEGEAWIQEANDYGYPVMPFHEHANYPGCSDRQMKSYAPEFPGTAPHFKMGGTGLSGLALSDATGAWPAPYADVMYVANPITRKIQAIKITRDGAGFRYEKLPDFINSSDEWFRPIAVKFGPDGCLYIVDWYNKIISHNEVPRNHPERDKTRGRIWRVKHKDQRPFAMPDFTKLGADELLAKLGGESLTQAHLAWQALADRYKTNAQAAEWREQVAPKLAAIIKDSAQSAERRIQALWTLAEVEPEQIWISKFPELAKDSNRNIRRELVRLNQHTDHTAKEQAAALSPLLQDPDPEVRAQLIRTVGARLQSTSSAPAAESLSAGIEFLLHFAKAPLTEPLAPSTQSGRPIKVGAAYDRDFERYLVRLHLERQPGAVAEFLDSRESNASAAAGLTAEARLLASLALEPRASASRVAALLPQLQRAPAQEEILRLAQFPDQPGVREALEQLLKNDALRVPTLEALLAVSKKVEPAPVGALIAKSTRELLAGSASERALALRAAADFQIKELEASLVQLAQAAGAPEEQHNVVKALRSIGSRDFELFAKLAGTGAAPIRAEALSALAGANDADAAERLLGLWPQLTAAEKRAGLGQLSATRAGGAAVVQAVKSGAIRKTDLDGPTVEKLQAVTGEDAGVAELLREMARLFRPVLALDGSGEAFTEPGISLDGPFTVETWVRLEPSISNEDGILGAPGVLDMNFYNSVFRVWIGDGTADAVVARKPIAHGVWTHLAVTRDDSGFFKIYMDGVLESDTSKAAPQKFEQLRIGWTQMAKGTAGALNEFRVWNRARAGSEIVATIDRSFAAVERPEGLVFLASGDQGWGKPHAGAKTIRTNNLPPLLAADEAASLDEKYTRYSALAEQPGDLQRGRLAAAMCYACHLINGEGANIGPNLSGVGAMGTEAILRNILMPNAAMEAGYRIYRVELKSGDLVEGFFASEDADAVLVRVPGGEERRVPKKEIRDATYLRRSLMPEGLLDAMSPQQVSDLFAFLKSLH